MMLNFGPWRVAWAAVALLIASLVALAIATYTDATRSAAIADARREAARRADLELSTLRSDVEKFRVLPFVLTELPDVRQALVDNSVAARSRLDNILKELANRTGASVIYAVDYRGIARSASNADGPDSFVGYDFRFRPYVQQALKTGGAEYFAEGAVTGRPGLFLARRAGPATKPYGVIVVKIEFDRIVKLWRSASSTSFVVNSDGIVIISTSAALQNKLVRPLSAERAAEIARTRQFNPAHLVASSLRFEGASFATDRSGRRYIAADRTLPSLGWRHVHIEPLAPTLERAASRSRWVAVAAALAAAGLIVLLYWVTNRRARAIAARIELEAEVSRRTFELSDAYARLQHGAAEREQADERYRAAREELAQANRLGSIGTITTSVAHEINQPIAAIRTAAENGGKLLGREQHDKVAANLSLIVSLTERVGAITSQLLSYARRGRDGRMLVRVDDIIDSALMLMSGNFRRDLIALEIDRNRGPTQIRVSRIRIEQVLVNILQNALDAVRGEPGAKVVMRVAVTGPTVRFSVSDNGPGIPASLGDAIFDPFVTGKPQGTGLGLGISREILSDYGGTLSAGRSDSGGATFEVVLPVAKDQL